MNINYKKLFICILIPLAVGFVSAFLTRNNMELFDVINKPKLSPPGQLFPIVWTILYICMGIASYLVCVSGADNQAALNVYAVQLIFNFFWSIIFFYLQEYQFAFYWLVVLWILILITTRRFYNISKPAGYLMIPYLLWVTFAGYLNWQIYILN